MKVYMASQTNSDRYLKDKGSFDIELAFASEVLKLPSLHYGYWLKNEVPYLSKLPIAQKRYTKFVCKNIPKDVKTILDVGAGVGDVSWELLSRGYQVTALSPNPTHKEILSKIGEGNKKFKYVFSKFEDLETNQKYDLLMFNESSSYIDIDKLFQKANLVVNPKGFVQVCDVFSRKSNPPIGKNIYYKHLLGVAKKHLFFEIKTIDITNNTVPSMQIGKDLNEKYVSPTLAIAKRYYDQEHPIRSFLIKTALRIFLKNEIKSFNDYFEKVFNPVEFKKHFTYQLTLFQRK